MTGQITWKRPVLPETVTSTTEIITQIAENLCSIEWNINLDQGNIPSSAKIAITLGSAGNVYALNLSINGVSKNYSIIQNAESTLPDLLQFFAQAIHSDLGCSVVVSPNDIEVAGNNGQIFSLSASSETSYQENLIVKMTTKGSLANKLLARVTIKFNTDELDHPTIAIVPVFFRPDGTALASAETLKTHNISIAAICNND